MASNKEEILKGIERKKKKARRMGANFIKLTLEECQAYYPEGEEGPTDIEVGDLSDTEPWDGFSEAAEICVGQEMQTGPSRTMSFDGTARHKEIMYSLYKISEDVARLMLTTEQLKRIVGRLREE